MCTRAYCVPDTMRGSLSMSSQQVSPSQQPFTRGLIKPRVPDEETEAEKVHEGDTARSDLARSQIQA